MGTVSFEHVTKTFRSRDGVVCAIGDLSLAVADREFIVLVGPSGCGKTTALRLIAGLEEPTSGTIRIGGRDVVGVPPKDRDVAMVFQNYALYPHMTVFKNMAFGLKMRRVPNDEIRRKVHEAAALLGIEHLLARRPAGLSGGERQRVAVGRAIVRKPRVFLFDEPLSNLDAGLRTHMRTELKSLHRSLETTIIYVTHDQEEAMTLGDRIAVMKDGVLQQCGRPLEVYNQPANRFVAGFIGTPAMNFLEGTLERDGEGTCFTGGVGRLVLPDQLATSVRECHGRSVVLGIRPEHVHLPASDAPASADRLESRRHRSSHSPPDDRGSFANAANLTVGTVEPLGDSIHVHLQTDAGESIVARVPPSVTVSPGRRGDLAMDLSCAHIFAADEAGERLG
jgi:multiple sugar transport system ATP-binding protein